MEHDTFGIHLPFALKSAQWPWLKTWTWYMFICDVGTSVSYQVDVLSMSDVLLTSSIHTVNPVTIHFTDVRHISNYHDCFECFRLPIFN